MCTHARRSVRTFSQKVPVFHVSMAIGSIRGYKALLSVCCTDTHPPIPTPTPLVFAFPLVPLHLHRACSRETRKGVGVVGTGPRGRDGVPFRERRRKASRKLGSTFCACVSVGGVGIIGRAEEDKRTRIIGIQQRRRDRRKLSDDAAATTPP